jgi:hypothetical protein
MPFKTIRSNDYNPDGAAPQLRETEAKTAAAKAKLAAVANLNANSSTTDLDKALKAIQVDALERGDITGAILVAQLRPRQPGQASGLK